MWPVHWTSRVKLVGHISSLTSHCLFFFYFKLLACDHYVESTKRERLKRQTKRPTGGRHQHVQRQSDHFPQTIASTDWTWDKPLEAEYKVQPSQVILLLLGDAAATRSWQCDREVIFVTWSDGGLRSSLSWLGLAGGIVTRCSHILPGHRPTIGGHCRVGTYPCREGDA